jgi:uncharacterized protein
MAEEKGQHEPSMEEILASIRRIIASDEGEGAAEAGAAAPADAEDDVLELTEVVEEEKPVAPDPDMPVAHDGSPLIRLDNGETLPRPEAAPAPGPAEESEPEPEPDVRLVSVDSAAASVAALSQLVNRPREKNSDLPLGNLGRTLEDMVRELMRPMLKEWLDQNLPPLVERIVREEVERLTREAQRH